MLKLVELMPLNEACMGTAPPNKIASKNADVFRLKKRMRPLLANDEILERKVRTSS